VILRSVKFDNDHLHEFSYRDRMGARVSVHHPAMDEPPYTDQVKIGTLPLEPGQTMDLTYDFGDNWPFTVKLERIEPPDAKLKAPASWRATARRRSSIRTGTTEPMSRIDKGTGVVLSTPVPLSSSYGHIPGSPCLHLTVSS